MNNHERLKTLSELDSWQLENSDQDLRGRPLLTRSGESLGIIRRMLVDRDQERVAAVVLDGGRAVAIEDVEIRDGNAYIDEATDLPGDTRFDENRSSGEQHIPIVEEELVVGKREVERGRIQVRSKVVETPVHEQVMLREEHVDVDRRPVNQSVGDADSLFQDRTLEVTERAEEAVVGKKARVTEELVVSKEMGQRTEQIDDKVRHTEVIVERQPDGRR